MKLQPKWTVLILAGLTNALVVAMPGMAMAVLFSEISQDLDLTLVQVGIIWGIGSLPGLLTGLLGGAIVDRFGPRRVVIAGVIFAGLTGALRGFSHNFTVLLITVILSGLIPPLINMSGMKNCGLWFPNRQLGLANGVLAMGMALGFLIGTFLSATVLSPWLGGWRNVMFFFGGIAVLLSIPWLFSPEPPAPADAAAAGPSAPQPGFSAIQHVLKIRDIWLLGFGLCGIASCVMATIGYLPLYLRGLGWTAIAADGALSSFHLMSLIFVMPIALLSDRLGSRKKLALVMGIMTVTGVVLLSASTSSAVIWPALVIAGMVRDGFMSVAMTMVMETEGIGARYAGTASGITMVFAMLGGLFASPVGNSLAAAAPGLPFVFWASLALGGIACISQTRRVKKEPATEVTEFTEV